MKPALLIVLFFFYFNRVGAQQVPVTAEQDLENLAEVLGEDIDDIYLQQLYELRKHPIGLNKASAEDLQQLKWLTDLQIQSFLQYRKALGALQSIYELQAIPLWDLATIRKVLPFIVIQDPTPVKELFIGRLKGGQHTFFLRNSRIVERQKGYDKSLSNHYAGSPDRLLVRYRYQYKNLLQYGITAEKDAGEAFFKGHQSNGFDFYSFHVFARQLGKIKAMAIGDFSVNLGQGLVQWQSLSFRKSSEVLQVKRQNPVLQPYTAATENNFNRGVGLTWQHKKLEVTGFASWRKISSTINNDTLGNTPSFSSLTASGLHRTVLENEKRNAIDYWAAGGSVAYKGAKGKVGVNSVYHRFSPVLEKQDKSYNYFAINGEEWSNASIDYSWTHKNIHAFGEAAVDNKLQKALLSGALLSVDPKVDVSVVYRNIQQGYQTLWGSAFTESVWPTNEKGIYTGIAIRPRYDWQIAAYADMYQIPWLKFRTDAPSKGTDFLVQATYKPNKQVELYARYKAEVKEQNTSIDSITHFLEQRPKQSFRLHILYIVHPSFTLKGRTEFLWYAKNRSGAEEGFVTYLQGDYDITNRLSANMRVQYFETGGYNSRIYVYESDVLYGYSIPAFYNKGFRYYVNAQYDLSKKLTIWGRWAQSLQKDQDKIGSGLDEIKGSHRSEYKIQVRWSL